MFEVAMFRGQYALPGACSAYAFTCPDGERCSTESAHRYFRCYQVVTIVGWRRLFLSGGRYVDHVTASIQYWAFEVPLLWKALVIIPSPPVRLHVWLRKTMGTGPVRLDRGTS